MLRHLTRLAIAGAVAATTLVGLGAGDLASAQTGPIGYTVGLESQGLGPCNFFAVDLSTGAAEQVNSDPVLCSDGLTFSADGTLYAFAQNEEMGFPGTSLVTIDVTDGSQDVIGDLPPISIGAGGMTFDAAGTLWLYGAPFTPGVDPDCAPDDFEYCLWRVNPADASTEFVGAAPGGTGVFGLAGNCDHVLAITTPVALGGSQTEVQSVDTATAALSLIVPTPDIFVPSGLDYDADDRLWAIGREPLGGFASDVQVHLIDLATGSVTTTDVTFEGAPFVGQLNGLAVSPITCPEPPPTPEPVVLAPTFTG